MQAITVSGPGCLSLCICRTFSRSTRDAFSIMKKASDLKCQNSIVLINIAGTENPVEIEIHGSACKKFVTFRTLDAEAYTPEQYKNIGAFEGNPGKIYINTPPGSVTIFLEFIRE